MADCNCRKNAEVIKNHQDIWYEKYWCEHEAMWIFTLCRGQDIKHDKERLLSEEQKKASTGRK